MSAIVSLINTIVGLLSSIVPNILAYFAGKKQVKAEIAKETLQTKEKVEAEVQKVDDKLKETTLGNYVRNNKI